MAGVAADNTNEVKTNRESGGVEAGHVPKSVSSSINKSDEVKIEAAANYWKPTDGGVKKDMAAAEVRVAGEEDKSRTKEAFKRLVSKKNLDDNARATADAAEANKLDPAERD